MAISASDMPEAKYSSTSVTVMLSPQNARLAAAPAKLECEDNAYGS